MSLSSANDCSKTGATARASSSEPVVEANKDDETPNPLGLTTEMAMRSYYCFLKASEERGKVVSPDGRHCGEAAPRHCTLANPELNFDKPEGYLVISRSFPCPSNKADDVKTTAQVELTAAGCRVDEETVRDCVQFQKELKITLYKKLNSKLKMMVDEEIVKQKLHNSVTNMACRDHAQVCSAYRHCPPRIDFFEQLYNVYVVPFEKEGIMNGLVYDVMCSLKLWYANDTKSLNQTKSGKAKVSAIRTIAGNKCRELRHPFTETKYHGVTLTISVKGGRQNGRRKRAAGFVEQEYVDGWGGKRHVEFCCAKGFASPEKRACGAVATLMSIAELQKKLRASTEHGRESVRSFVGWL